MESRTYLGLPIQLYQSDMGALVYLLNNSMPIRIIELGTGLGVSSLFFIRTLPFTTIYTFDIVDRRVEQFFIFCKIHFKQLDIFSQFSIEYIYDRIKTYGTTFVFCDNGDKPREFKQFAPFLKPGDYIAVHDYGVEIFDKDIQPVIIKHNLKEVLLPGKSLIRAYKKE